MGENGMTGENEIDKLERMSVLDECDVLELGKN